MREFSISRKLNFLYGMTFAAILGDCKGGFTIMTGTAGFTLLHLSHGVTLALGTGSEDFIVAVVTLVNRDMKRVTEQYFPGIRKVKDHISYTVMTSVTAACDTEGNICVMTGTAGTVFLHIPHGVSATPFPAGKYTAVTVSTDVHLFYRVSMDLMAENCRDLLETDIRQ
jgi:hypothetical protein